MIRLNGTGENILGTAALRYPEVRQVLDWIEARIPRKHRREIERFQAAALYLLVRDEQPKRILEIGTAHGYSAAVMAAAAPDAQIVTLNPDVEEAAVAEANLRALHFGGRVGVVRERSQDILSKVGAEMFDVIFVDGDHKAIREDLRWWSHLPDGGWMVFHDFSPVTSWRACPPVYVAVNEFGDQLGREADWLCVDDAQVGMAGYQRHADDKPHALLQSAPEGIIRAASHISVLPPRRLRHLWQIANATSAEGAVVCLGAGAGGAAAVLAHGMWDIAGGVWLFDTFAGIPEPTEPDGLKAHAKWHEKGGRWLVYDQEMTRQAVAEIINDSPRMVAGLVQDTIMTVREQIGKIAILHLDVDWYEPTMYALDTLYDQVVSGGAVIPQIR